MSLATPPASATSTRSASMEARPAARSLPLPIKLVECETALNNLLYQALQFMPPESEAVYFTNIVKILQSLQTVVWDEFRTIQWVVVAHDVPLQVSIAYIGIVDTIIRVGRRIPCALQPYTLGDQLINTPQFRIAVIHAIRLWIAAAMVDIGQFRKATTHRAFHQIFVLCDVLHGSDLVFAERELYDLRTSLNCMCQILDRLRRACGTADPVPTVYREMTIFCGPFMPYLDQLQRTCSAPTPTTDAPFISLPPHQYPPPAPIQSGEPERAALVTLLPLNPGQASSSITLSNEVGAAESPSTSPSARAGTPNFPPQRVINTPEYSQPQLRNVPPRSRHILHHGPSPLIIAVPRADTPSTNHQSASGSSIHTSVNDEKTGGDAESRSSGRTSPITQVAALLASILRTQQPPATVTSEQHLAQWLAPKIAPLGRCLSVEALAGFLRSNRGVISQKIPAFRDIFERFDAARQQPQKPAVVVDASGIDWGLVNSLAAAVSTKESELNALSTIVGDKPLGMGPSPPLVTPHQNIRVERREMNSTPVPGHAALLAGQDLDMATCLLQSARRPGPITLGHAGVGATASVAPLPQDSPHPRAPTHSIVDKLERPASTMLEHEVTVKTERVGVDGRIGEDLEVETEGEGVHGVDEHADRERGGSDQSDGEWIPPTDPVSRTRNSNRHRDTSRFESLVRLAKQYPWEQATTWKAFEVWLAEKSRSSAYPISVAGAHSLCFRERDKLLPAVPELGRLVGPKTLFGGSAAPFGARRRVSKAPLTQSGSQAHLKRKASDHDLGSTQTMGLSVDRSEHSWRLKIFKENDKEKSDCLADGSPRKPSTQAGQTTPFSTRKLAAAWSGDGVRDDTTPHVDVPCPTGTPIRTWSEVALKSRPISERERDRRGVWSALDSRMRTIHITFGGRNAEGLVVPQYRGVETFPFLGEYKACPELDTANPFAVEKAIVEVIFFETPATKTLGWSWKFMVDAIFPRALTSLLKVEDDFDIGYRFARPLVIDLANWVFHRARLHRHERKAAETLHFMLLMIAISDKLELKRGLMADELVAKTFGPKLRFLQEGEKILHAKDIRDVGKRVARYWRPVDQLRWFNVEPLEADSDGSDE